MFFFSPKTNRAVLQILLQLVLDEREQHQIIGGEAGHIANAPRRSGLNAIVDQRQGLANDACFRPHLNQTNKIDYRNYTHAKYAIQFP